MKLQEKGGFQGIPEIALEDAQLRSHFGQVKIFRIDLKLLRQLGFGPNFPVMVEAGNPEKSRN